MKEEIEKRRAEAAEKKKMKEDESTKPAFTVSPKGSSKVRDSQTLWSCGSPRAPRAPNTIQGNIPGIFKSSKICSLR